MTGILAVINAIYMIWREI